MQADRDAHVRRIPGEAAIDQCIAAQRLHQIDVHRQHRLARRAGFEVLRANAEQNVLPVSLRRDQVHRRRADEAGDEGRGRPGVDIQRGADLLGTAGVHHDHALRHGHGFHLVVRDVQAGGRQPPVQRLQFRTHLHPQLGVEVRQWFVEEEHRRLAHDGTAHRDALALAAGKVARSTIKIGAEFEDLCRTLDVRLNVGGLHAADLEAVGHVLAHRHVRIERVVLEHHGDVAVLGFEVVHHALADRDLAGGDCLQSRHHAQQRRLAAARRSDHHHEFAVADVHIDALDHLYGAEGLVNIADRYAGHYCFLIFRFPRVP